MDLGKRVCCRVSASGPPDTSRFARSGSSPSSTLTTPGPDPDAAHGHDPRLLADFWQTSLESLPRHDLDQQVNCEPAAPGPATSAHGRPRPPAAGPAADRDDPIAASTCGRDVRPYGSGSTGTILQAVDDSIPIEPLRALGDPVRWSIVREPRHGTRCACRLAEVAGVSPALLSHHLKVFREAGVISGEMRGRWIDHTLESRSLGQLALRLSPILVLAP